MSQSEQIPEFDPEEHQEAGLGDFSPEEVDALTKQVAAEHGKPDEAEVEDEPLDEDELLAVGARKGGTSRMGFQVSGMRKVAAILRARGIKVTEVSGWTTRGRSTFEPRAVVCHWTAATRSITPMLVHGRPGIPGPLCNFELLPGNNGVKLVAAGKANHAGVARTGFTNSVAFGIEAAGPPIGAEEMKVYHALVAAICKVHRFPANERVRDHAGVALPAGRKSDISRDHDMGEFRRRVAALLASPEKREKRDRGRTANPGTRACARSACTARRAVPGHSSP